MSSFDKEPKIRPFSFEMNKSPRTNMIDFLLPILKAQTKTQVVARLFLLKIASLVDTTSENILKYSP